MLSYAQLTTIALLALLAVIAIIANERHRRDSDAD